MKFSVETSMDEVKPVTTDKDEYEHRTKSIYNSTFGTLGFSVFDAGIKINEFSRNPPLLQK